MKELICSNFQLTRATGVPTIFTVDGVHVEMRRSGAAPALAKTKKAKAKKRRKPAKAGRAQEKPTAEPAKTGKPPAARRTEAAPQ